MAERTAHDDPTGPAADSLETLSRLTGWMAHEINNPLAGIQNAFALIRGAVPESHPHFKYVAAVDRELARLAALTRRVQLAYGFDASRNAQSPLARCVASALAALEPLSSARAVTARIEIDPAAGSQLVTDRVAAAAIRHLVQHALETAPREGSICVRGGRDGRRLWLSVPHREREAGGASAGAAGPAGLALQLVEHLVAAFAGDIEWLPAAAGDREVRIWIPLRPESEESQ